MLHPSTSIKILSDSEEATQKVIVYCSKGEMKTKHQIEHAAKEKVHSNKEQVTVDKNSTPTKINTGDRGMTHG